MKKLLPFAFLLLNGCVSVKESRRRVDEAKDLAWQRCASITQDLVLENKAKTDLLKKFNQIGQDGKLRAK